MRFNTKVKTTKITNYAGAPAYKMDAAHELYSAVVTTGFNDTFYESQDKRLLRIQELLKNTDPAFSTKLAVYARTKMNMRSIPQVMMVELAKLYSGNPIIRKGVTNVIQRADEITEMLAYYQSANKRNGAKKLNKLSKQVQKGIATSFNKFDEYQFAKYNQSKEVKLKDALFLVHPKAKDEAQQIIFNKIANDTLDTPYTWEVELSVLGQKKFESIQEKEAAFKAKWEELIDSGKIGYMALLRNLRNIVEAKVNFYYIDKVCNTLADAQAVLKSKQLPFRFLSAYREIIKLDSYHTPLILDALEAAIKVSANNIKGFDGNTNVVIACDVSGSMQMPISAKSTVILYDIGLVLGMLMKSRCKSVISGMFGNTWKAINMPSSNILANVQEYYKREGEVGYSTNGHLVVEDLLRKGIVADKVMLFTDVQLWNSNNDGTTLEKTWINYKNAVAPNAKLYLFDLAGHGNAPLDIKRNDVHLIAGWSDKIFEILNAVEGGSNAIKEINNIEL